VTVSTVTIADQVWTLLLTTTVANKYRGDFLDSAGRGNTPPLGVNGRTVGYFIAYFGAGRNTGNRVCPAPNQTSFTFQVTCAGGTDAVALGVVDKVRAVLTGKRLSGGIIQELTDSVLTRDETVNPTRMYQPLLFGVNVNG
jgi:hypothetical protein